MENNIKIALIEHRTGLLDQIPESLNQSEIGFAYDASRLFIGNPNNNELRLRTTFPYQNVEILTEFSELNDYIKYRYVNNFEKIGDETSREKLIERTPFVISCDTYHIPENDMTITINGVSFTIFSGMTIVEFALLINAHYEETNTSVFVNSKNKTSLIFVCTNNFLEISANAEVIELLGLPSEIDEVAKELPIRKIFERLDDTLHVTDFGVKPSTGEDISETLMKFFVSIYNKFDDIQTHRRIFFPAGSYLFSDSFDSFYSLPLLSGTSIYGEGTNNTVFEFSPSFINYASQVMNKQNQYGSEDTYIPERVSDIYIHDVTFKSDSGFGSVYLRNVKNVLFENVTFIGKGDLITIIGDSSDLECTNIKFLNCVFFGGINQVYIKQNTNNVLFDGCRFENSSGLYVKIGDNNLENANISKIIFDNNVFSGLDFGPYVNYVGGQSTYVSFTNSQFDSVVVERQENHPIPFNKDFNYSGYNFTDTLDPTTDSRKFLRFKFTQPIWDYVNQLIDTTGVLTFNTRRDEELETSEHTFVDLQVSDENINLSVQGEPASVNFSIENEKGNISITASDQMNISSNSLTVETVSDINMSSSSGNVSIITPEEASITATGDITLASTNKINLAAPTNFGGTIDLQNSDITNSMNKDITFITTNGQVASIIDTNLPDERTYGERAIDNENAIVTTSMLQRFQSSVHGFASSQNITSAGNVSLYDCSQYHSDNFVLKELDVNFIIPPEYVCVDEKQGFPYVYSYVYPKNTILYMNGKQYIVTTTFAAKIETDVSSTAIGAYIKSELPFYDDQGNVKTSTDIYYETIHFYNGDVGYHLVSTDPDMNIVRSVKNDYVLDGHTYTAFTDNEEEIIYLRDFEENECSFEDKISLIYETVISSDEPIEPYSAEKYIDSFDVILISNIDNQPTYYVLGRVENINESYVMNTYPYNNKATEGCAIPYNYNLRYLSNEIFSYQGIRYICINDDMYEDIFMEGYKLIQLSNGLYQYIYRDSNGEIYIKDMDADFSDYLVFNPDGTQATQEDSDEFNANLEEIIDLDQVDSIFDGTSTVFTADAEPSKDYTYRNEFYKTPDEKFVRILDQARFKKIDIKGISYKFTGSTGIYETTGEKTSDVIRTVNLEELNLKNCIIAVRFFNKDGDHIAEFSNSDALESLKIGFFIEGIR